MTDRAASPASLYDLLDEPAPAAASLGETSRTAAKETLDADTEAVEGDVIYGRGA